MINIFKYLSVLAVGILIGAIFVWVSTYLNTYEKPKNIISLEKVLRHANLQIPDDKFSCEGETRKTVGAVVGSIYDINNQHIRNMVSLKCIENVCDLSISNCKPWQSSECGSRHLKFEINIKNEIDPKSFECIDVP